MSDDASPGPNGETGTGPDDDYAPTNLAGYHEGARSDLRDLLDQASRGHTVAELRLLVQSRLAHLPEELELRRRRLVALPRSSPWGLTPSHSGPPRPWGTRPASVRVVPGSQVLVREERPHRAVELAREAAPRFGLLVVVSPDPPPFPGVPEAKRRTISLPAGGEGPSLESLAGQMGGLLRTPPGVLIYLDAIETVSLQDGAETALRFVNWVLAQAREHGGAVIAAVHPRVLPPKDQSLLERAFQVVL